MPEEARIDERSLSKLKWRCRRGLLENDLFIERFFQHHEATLTVRQAAGLTTLMELSDHDLLDLNLGRKPLAAVAPEMDREEVREVLTMLQQRRGVASIPPA